MIEVIKDVDLYDNVDKYDAILIGTNINCSMSQGFQRKVMLNYPYVQEENMKTRYGDEKKLGTVLECKEEGSPTFVLLYIAKGNTRPDVNKEYMSYEALEKCLKIVNVLYKGQNLASTFIGTSKFDGNGDKERVMKILSENTDKVNLTIYDYEQLSRHDELKKVRVEELKLKETDIDAYYEAVKKRKEEADERFKKNKHARY